MEETIRKIKLAHGRDGKTIVLIVRDFNLSRNTVRKVLRSEATRFGHHRTVQPMQGWAGLRSGLSNNWSTMPASIRRIDARRRFCLSSFRGVQE